MQYLALASRPYGSGRIMFMPSRLNYRNTGGDSVYSSFIRSCLEWLSQSDEYSNIELCYVAIGTVDGTSPVMDASYRVGVARHDAEYLSSLDNLYQHECIVVSGTEMSPIIRSNLLSYVSSGGGLLVTDATDSGYIDLFSDSPISASSDSYIRQEGSYVWTSSGRSHQVFSDNFVPMTVPLLNTVYLSDVGSSWTNLIIFDTDIEQLDDSQVDELTLVSSDDAVIYGLHFTAYFSSTYENGIIELDE